jgi:hypothetical protein
MKPRQLGANASTNSSALSGDERWTAKLKIVNGVDNNTEEDQKLRGRFFCNQHRILPRLYHQFSFRPSYHPASQASEIENPNDLSIIVSDELDLRRTPIRCRRQPDADYGMGEVATRVFLKPWPMSP